MKRQFYGNLVVALLAAVTQLPAQAAPQAPPTWEQMLARQWKGLHNKILTMAKDTLFPDAKLETRPHADSRAVLDEYRHVTIGLEMSTAQLRGTPFDYQARLKADEAKPRTRAAVVAEMEAAVTASYTAVEASASPALLFWLEHQAEHYGKLVSDYRIAGVVPPISRPRMPPRP